MASKYITKHYDGITESDEWENRWYVHSFLGLPDDMVYYFYEDMYITYCVEKKTIQYRSGTHEEPSRDEFKQELIIRKTPLYKAIYG